jgi:hypothetical protein
LTERQTGCAERVNQGRVRVPLALRERVAGRGFVAVERFLSAIALDVHLEDRGVVNEAVDGGERHRLIGKNPSPFATWLMM